MYGLVSRLSAFRDARYRADCARVLSRLSTAMIIAAILLSCLASSTAQNATLETRIAATDWSIIRGANYVPSYASNAYEICHYGERYISIATSTGAPTNGKLGVPPGPGLGVELKPEFLKSDRVSIESFAANT